jgi:hypothetical protein
LIPLAYISHPYCFKCKVQFFYLLESISRPENTQPAERKRHPILLQVPPYPPDATSAQLQYQRPISTSRLPENVIPSPPSSPQRERSDLKRKTNQRSGACTDCGELKGLARVKESIVVVMALSQVWFRHLFAFRIVCAESHSPPPFPPLSLRTLFFTIQLID